eukprot:2400497-Alexandrium_andersonii.AAC.1
MGRDMWPNANLLPSHAPFHGGDIYRLATNAFKNMESHIPGSTGGAKCRACTDAGATRLNHSCTSSAYTT